MTGRGLLLAAAGYLVAVLAGAVVCGYVLVLRRQTGLGAWVAGVLKHIGERVSRKETRAELMRRRLQAAGYRTLSSLHLLYGIKCASAGLLGLLCASLALWAGQGGASALVAGCAGLGAGYLAPDVALDRRIRARRSRLRAGLPAALELWALGLDAGQTLDQAVVSAAGELGRVFPELSAELAAIHLEMRAGRRRADVFADLAARTPEPELKKVCKLLIDSDRFGASLAPAIQTHARYLRIRARQKAREAAEKVSVKLVFPIFLLIFPAVVLITLGPSVLEITRSLGSLLK